MEISKRRYVYLIILQSFLVVICTSFYFITQGNPKGDFIKFTQYSQRDNVCNDACQRFRTRIFKANQHKTSEKAAIYMLIGNNRYSDLNNALQLLYVNFLKKFPYPVILFHENQFRHNELHRELWKDDIDLYTQSVVFSFPKGLNMSRVPEKTICGGHKVGYRHMCRFQAKTVYDQPVLKGLRYTWRLDDDSKLLKPIDYDIFQFMSDKNLKYSYLYKGVEPPPCVRGLWQGTQQFMDIMKVDRTTFNTWPQNIDRSYYNNFEVSDMSLWNSDLYRKYVNYIDGLGGTFYHRWGDAPIRTLAVMMMLNQSQVHNFDDVTYRHQLFCTKC